MMTAAVNKNHNDDAIIRISPGRNTLTVETKGTDGSITYKEISPVEFYYTINQSYLPTISMSSGFLPENCLHVSMNSRERTFVLWNPELRADVAYGVREYPDFPIPRMVFGIRILATGRVADCSIGVVADGTPTPETPMFHYPFSNVHQNGDVCSGNNVMPKYGKQTALRNFPRYLLGLPDNDDMYNPANNKLGLAHGDLMEHLKDKNPAYYYSDILIPNGKTLDDFINRR